jgi:hypothetical protein
MPLKVVAFDSPYDPDEVHRRLVSVVSPGVSFWGTPKPSIGESGQPPEFLGKVYDRDFKIRRIIRYRNSFLPIIRGTVAPRPGGGSHVRLVMALHVAIAVFMLGWFGLFTWLLAMSGSLKGAIAVPVILIIFGGVMTVGGFVYEANKSEEALRRLLGAA